MKRIVTECVIFALACSSRLGGQDTNLAWAWGNEGHAIVACIAADNLSSTAQTRIARMLGVSDTKPAVAQAMAQAAVRPDVAFRDRFPETTPWHFIDLCLQDTQHDLPARCPAAGCIVSKLDAYVTNLRTGQFDAFGADGALAFVLHFVGDLHQPLHASTNDDRGGNCRPATTHPPSTQLHDTWDRVVVTQLEHALHTHGPVATAHALEQRYHKDKQRFTWPAEGTAAVAWESTQLARTAMYTALQIPTAVCAPDLTVCPAPPFPPVTVSAAKLAQERDRAGQQLAKAGYRLASLLNSIWP
jgi:hypothetical protein